MRSSLLSLSFLALTVALPAFANTQPTRSGVPVPSVTAPPVVQSAPSVQAPVTSSAPDGINQEISRHYMNKDFTVIEGQITAMDETSVMLATPTGQAWKVNYDDFKLNPQERAMMTAGTSIKVYSEYDEDDFGRSVIDNPKGIVIQSPNGVVHLKD